MILEGFLTYISIGLFLLYITDREITFYKQNDKYLHFSMLILFYPILCLLFLVKYLSEKINLK